MQQSVYEPSPRGEGVAQQVRRATDEGLTKMMNKLPDKPKLMYNSITKNVAVKEPT